MIYPCSTQIRLVNMDTNKETLLLSVKDAAESICVCRTKLYDLMNDGQIESVKIGSRRLVLRESLNSFVLRLKG